MDKIHGIIDGVLAIVGNDGTGDVGIIVRQALHDDANATAQEIAEIVCEARDDFRAEREANRS